MADDTLAVVERRKAWRHVFQCVLAEQEARTKERSGEPGAMAQLLAEGVRLDAAIDALDETLEPRRTS